MDFPRFVQLRGNKLLNTNFLESILKILLEIIFASNVLAIFRLYFCHINIYAEPIENNCITSFDIKDIPAKGNVDIAGWNIEHIQIDHVLIENKHLKSIIHRRSYRRFKARYTTKGNE